MASATRELPDVVPSTIRPAVDFVITWSPLLIVAFLWEFASGRFVSARSLPPPSIVANAFYDMVFRGDLLVHLGISLWRVGWGLAFSISIGVLLGIGMARSRSVENFFDVILAMLYPIPKAGLVPLAILWFGRGTDMAIFIIFLATLLPIVLNSYNAAMSVDQSLIWSAQMMGTSERWILWKVVIPDTIPDIVTGIRQSIPIAFIALTGAEFIGAGEGVGAVILETGQLGLYPRMFAAIVLISATAFIALRGFDRLERRVVKWA